MHVSYAKLSEDTDNWFLCCCLVTTFLSVEKTQLAFPDWEPKAN
jgi:hypothetical protein